MLLIDSEMRGALHYQAKSVDVGLRGEGSVSWPIEWNVGELLIEEIETGVTRWKLFSLDVYK